MVKEVTFSAVGRVVCYPGRCYSILVCTTTGK